MTGILTKEQVAELEKKLHPDHVSKRKSFGSGPTLSYIEAWHAIAEANRIFGFDNWERETVQMLEASRTLVDTSKGTQWRVSYIAKCRITVGRTIVREGSGYGSGFAPENDIGQAIESAVKEAESDAMKRALMTFGNPFGLALYDKTQANVGIEEGGPNSEAYLPAKGGGVKDAPGYTGGQMNSSGKLKTLAEIDDDMLDVKTNLQLDALYRVWQPTLKKWGNAEFASDEETSWHQIVMNAFKAKRQELSKTTDPHPLEAGE